MQIEIINKSVNPNPTFGKKGDACMDLRVDFSHITPEEPIKAFGNCQFVFKSEVTPNPYLVLDPGARACLPTKLFMAIPYGYEGVIRPRSGLTIKEGLVAQIGTVDSNYRGEIMITVINQGVSPVVIDHTERVAQLAIRKVEEVEWINVETLDETERGAKGFGSSGKY